MDEEQLPDGVTHIETFLKTQRPIRLTAFQLAATNLLSPDEFRQELLLEGLVKYLTRIRANPRAALDDPELGAFCARNLDFITKANADKTSPEGVLFARAEALAPPPPETDIDISRL